MPSYVYRVTKYDPADRDEHGSYEGPEDTDSDHGEVEAAYLRAVAAFAEDTGVGRLVVREPQVASYVHFGLEPVVEGYGLDGLFPSGLEDFHDGVEVSLDTGLELVRAMLRDNGAWCRLEVDDVFAVHVGWDQYLYVSSNVPCSEAVARTCELGLFPEPLHSSPYAFEDDDEGVQRPGDDEFWSCLRRAVCAGEAGVLEETYVDNATRWHRLTSDSLATVRAGLASRARVEVWPPLSTHVTSVLKGLSAEDYAEGVWQDDAGRLHSAFVDEESFPQLVAEMSRARAAAVVSIVVDERMPLMTAVMPDDDGVLRARWRTTPTPDDRLWALRRETRKDSAG
ncbi:RNA-binding protein [Streptomyces sp. NPDC002734]|uniref:RNA-binding protein n=1 Tax=Streptomyces sp. NPDC002734 TaxID=3154426 RepID=UPI00331E9C22